MKKLLLQLLIIFFPIMLFADKYTDSLSKKLTGCGECEQAYYLNLLSRHFYETSAVKCKKLADLALENALKCSNIKEEATAYYNNGAYYYICSDYSTSLNYFIKAFEKYRAINDNYGQATSLNGVGLIFEVQGDYSYAVLLYKEALKIMQEIQNVEGVAGTINNIAKIYYNIKEYDLALKYLFNNLSIAEKLKNVTAINSCLQNINVVYMANGDYEKALINYERMLKSQQNINDKAGIIKTLKNTGKLYYKINKPDEALKKYSQAIIISEEIGDESTMSSIFLEMGILFNDKKDYPNALQYFEKSRVIALKLNLKETLLINYQYLSGIYEKQGKYQSALTDYQMFKAISDSISSAKLNKQISGFRSNYETLRKEKEIENLKKEKEIQELTINKQFYAMFFLLSITFLLALLVFIFVRRFRRKQHITKILEAANNELAESGATQERIISLLAHDLKSPIASFYGLTEHMLNEYNSLDNSVKKKFLEQLVVSAKSVMEILENTLQWVLFKKDKHKFRYEKIKLLELVNFTFSLLSVYSQKKNITMESDIAQDFTINNDKNILLTVLRNLISNAIKFTHDNGKIFVSAETSGDKFSITIKDTGVGISEENMKKLFSKNTQFSTLGTAKESGSGLGLLLCREMIEMCNGRLLLSSMPGEGSTAVIELPEENK